MRLRRIMATVTATAALLAPIVAYAPAAHATSVCLENNTLTFNPPLTLSNQIGTATLQWSNTCPDLPGLNGGQNGNTYTYSYFGYFGSCAFAILTEGTESVVIGGTVYLEIYVGGIEKVEVMTPNQACPVASAHGTGVVVYV
jgi:hypothetical protein